MFSVYVWYAGKRRCARVVRDLATAKDLCRALSGVGTRVWVRRIK